VNPQNVDGVHKTL